MLDGALRWRICDGKSIRVWEDSWLGGPGLGRVVSPRTNLAAETTLNFFINADSKRWNEKLVRDHFLAFEAEQILSTSIRLDDKKDELCWVYGGDGVLRMKDVYSHAVKEVNYASISVASDPL